MWSDSDFKNGQKAMRDRIFQIYKTIEQNLVAKMLTLRKNIGTFCEWVYRVYKVLFQIETRISQYSKYDKYDENVIK